MGSNTDRRETMTDEILTNLANAVKEYDNAGAPVFENKDAVVDRNAGNFGGDRGPKATPIILPEEQGPDFRVESAIPREGALGILYGTSSNPTELQY
jgi:hypothetical protein